MRCKNVAEATNNTIGFKQLYLYTGVCLQCLHSTWGFEEVQCRIVALVQCGIEVR